MELEKVYVVTLWSGGRAARKWKTLTRPAALPEGTGVEFTCLETKLSVKVIGHISVEEYEQGMDLPEQLEPKAFGPEKDETTEVF